MTWQEFLLTAGTQPARPLLALWAAAARRLREDHGDVSLISVAIIAGALAAAALVLVAAITGKLNNFIAQIPG